MRKNKLRLLFAFASVTLLVACSSKGTSSSTSTEEITDLVGRKISVNTSSLSKVVCIGAGALRLYTYINGSSLLSGVEDIDNPSKNSDLNKQFASSPRPYYMVYGDSLKELPSVGKGGPSNQAAEKELIASCSPDLVISEYEDVEAANELQNAIGIPVAVVKYDSKNIFGDTIYSSLRLIGKLVGKKERAEELITYMESSVKEVNDLTKDVKDEDKKSVYLGCLGSWGVQDIFMTSSSYPLFNIGNIKNAASSLLTGAGFQTIDQEAFFTLNPDIIILDASGIGKFKTTYNGSLKASFDSLNAFKNGNLYLQMPYNNYFTNIETALMDLYYDASVAFPGLFASLDIEKKSNEITKKFLGKEIYAEMSSLPNSYGGFQKIDVSTFLKA